jgi:hypothetical protein
MDPDVLQACVRAPEVRTGDDQRLDFVQGDRFYLDYERPAETDSAKRD